MALPKWATRFKSCTFDKAYGCGRIVLEDKRSKEFIKSVVRTISTEHNNKTTVYRAWEKDEEPETEQVLFRYRCKVDNPRCTPWELMDQIVSKME